MIFPLVLPSPFTKESAHTRFYDFSCHHHNYSSSSSVNPSDFFSLVLRCCGRSSSLSRCTLNDAICRLLSIALFRASLVRMHSRCSSLRIEPLLRNFLAAKCQSIANLLSIVFFVVALIGRGRGRGIVKQALALNIGS